jgi:hypothetical protein
VFVIPALSVTFAERYLEYMQAQKITKIAIAHDTMSVWLSRRWRVWISPGARGVFVWGEV